MRYASGVEEKPAKAPSEPCIGASMMVPRAWGYPQIALVTSVRGILFLPQIAARSAESVLVAKSPMPFFFIIAAVFLPDACTTIK